MKKTNLDRLIKRVLSEKKLNLNEEKCYCSTDGSKVHIGGCNPCSMACCQEAGYDDVWSGSPVRGGTKRGKGKGMRAKLQKEQFGATDICDTCMAHYAFSASKRHKYCTGPNGVCNGGPLPCDLCRVVYAFSKKKRDKHCNCKTCPCGTGVPHLGVDKYHSGPKEDMPQFGSMGENKTMTVSESSLINTIEKIVKEKSAMLGFGNMGGLSLGVSKPSDKYELDEDSQDTNTSNTYNVNLMNQQAANQNMEDWEMGEDYSIEKGSHGHPHDDIDEQCGDGVYEQGCGDRVYENVGRLLRKNIKEVQRKQLRNWIKK